MYNKNLKFVSCLKLDKFNILKESEECDFNMIEIKEPYGFIYITTNIINGKRYIGQRKFSRGCNTYLGSGKTFKQAIKKYGKSNFIRDIVDIAYSKKELDKLEIEYIINYNAVKSEDFYNIASGGEGGIVWNGESPKKGSKMPEEVKYKISRSLKGKYVGEKHSCYGRHHSNESKKKMKENHADFTGRNNFNCKKVICLTTGKVFEYIKEASEFYRCNRVTISECCKKKRKSSGKLEDGTPLRWMYYDEYIKQNQLLIHNENLGQVV